MRYREPEGVWGRLGMRMPCRGGRMKGACRGNRRWASLLDLPFINYDASPFHDEPQTEIEGCKHEPGARGNYSNSSAACT